MSSFYDNVAILFKHPTLLVNTGPIVFELVKAIVDSIAATRIA